jgi:hypothetical protein
MQYFDRIGITGRRKRSIAKFILSASSAATDGWVISRVPAASFSQKVGDDRALVRTFHEMAAVVTEDPRIQTLTRAIAEKVRVCRPEARVLKVHLHQVCIFADLMGAGDNAPEGIHQDGADYIVSALVLEREGIVGGESIIYAPDKETVLLRHTLLPGEGIFQEDRILWHDVTPIAEDPASSPTFGHRSILGYDLEIIG